MKKALSLILAVIMVMSLVACGGKNNAGNDKADAGTNQQQPPKQEEPKAHEDTKIEASEKTEDAKYAEEVTIVMSLGSLDPGDSWNSQREAYQFFVFDPLYNVDQVTGETRMMLAKSVDWVDDKFNALKVVLRDDVVFSNGEKVTTADVEFSLGRNTYSNMTAYYDHSEIISDTEMIIHMKKAYKGFYDFLGMACGAVVCKSEAEKHPDGLALIGSGPFKYDMDSYVAADTVTMVRNDKFWGETTPTQRVKIVNIKDASAAGIALQNREINFFYNLNPSELTSLSADEDVQIKEFSSYNFIYMGFNDKCDTTALTEEEKNFRRAVACAINREDIIAGIGGGSIQTTIWPFDHPDYATMDQYDYDLSFNPEKAKEYLAAAGGKTEFTVLVNTSSSWLKVSAQIIQEYLRQVGITMNIEETDGTGFSAMTKWGTFEYDAFLHSNLYSIRAGSYGMLNEGSNTNRATISAPEFREYLEAAQVAPTAEEQSKSHLAIFRFVNENCSYVPLVWRNMNFGYTTGLENFSVSAGPCFYMRDIALRLN